MIEKCEYASTYEKVGIEKATTMLRCDKFSRNNSLGFCRSKCPENTTGGVWPDLPKREVVQSITVWGKAVAMPALQNGPGTELMKLIAELGVTTFAGCGCKSKIAQMNAWGSDECEKQTSVILVWLKEAWAKAEAAEIARLTKLGQPIPPQPKMTPEVFDDMLKSLIAKAIENARVAA